MLKKDLENKIIQTAQDVAIIKDKLPSLITKVDKHEGYFYISYGCIIIIGLVLGIRAF